MVMHVLLVILGLLLVIEWMRRSVAARLTAVLLALFVVLAMPQGPHLGRAYRRALSIPQEQRVLEMDNWGRLSDYTSGVFTMMRAVEEERVWGAPERGLSIGALVWLSVSPIFRRKRRAEPATQDQAVA
jgi:hypothetical protein